MKVKNLAVLLLACGMTLTGLTSCGATLDNSAYGVQKGDGLGDSITKIHMTETKGYIDSISIMETYTPRTWANIDPDELDGFQIDTIDFTGDDAQGNSIEYHLAKHIKIGDLTFTGSLRVNNDDNALFIKQGEVIKYSYDNPDDSDDTRLDLNKYLSISDAEAYKLGSRAGWYFEAVAKDEISVLGYDKEDEEKTLKACDYTLGFPEGEKFINDCQAEAGWASSVNALCDYLAGKQLDFKMTATDEDFNDYTTIKAIDGTWYYSPSLAHDDFSDPENSYEKIEGCSSEELPLRSFLNIMKLANILFASMEYDSVK